MKQKAISAYQSLIKSGHLLAANRVLRLFSLGLNDADFAAECALESAGLIGRCGRGGNSMIFELPK
ncbi:hypothetical protein [Desulfobulbus elongatus]|uniref:hypothetical protein n=1 Tax=Desulfobulbus elongatus TaxID=53332 RepID=UPI0004835124|nr:hypothetical protein [Desulfobulbus elongatus]